MSFTNEKQAKAGIPFGPCAFESLKISIKDKDRTRFPNGDFSPQLHKYLKKHLPQLNYLYCNYNGDSIWIQVEGVDEERNGLGIAGVLIHDDPRRLYWSYENPKYQGDQSGVEAGGSWVPKWNICDDREVLLTIIETFLTTGRAWEGCQWQITEGD